jgi:hypothetical protein
MAGPAAALAGAGPFAFAGAADLAWGAASAAAPVIAAEASSKAASPILPTKRMNFPLLVAAMQGCVQGMAFEARPSGRRLF